MTPPVRIAVGRLRLFDGTYEVDEQIPHLTLIDFRTDDAAEATLRRLNAHMWRLAQRDAPHRPMDAWRLDVHDHFTGELLFTWSYAEFGDDR